MNLERSVEDRPAVYPDRRDAGRLAKLGGAMWEASHFEDRADAGRVLAEAVRKALPQPADAIVLALPRGGVPVGYEVARPLGLPLDVMIVRKLGAPFQPELAMGAIASGGVRVLNPEVVALTDVGQDTIDRVEQGERAELERRETTYRGDRPLPRLEGRTLILVDDGVATGSTMLAAVEAVRSASPARVVVAVPVATPEVVKRLERSADLVVCPRRPVPFFAIGLWYRDFPQLTDEDVRSILHKAWSQEAARAGAGGTEAPSAASSRPAPSADPGYRPGGYAGS